MKTIKYLCGMLAVSAMFLMSLPTRAQITPDTYFNIDWQINLPLSNGFAENGSGWGANFEGGYYLSPSFALGGFLNYHTNHEYISRRTIQLNNTASMSTDQQHSLFQLPFGVTAHYRFDYNKFQPYVGLKLGAQYAHMTSDFYIYEESKNTWGFYMSPEIGFEYYPWPNGLGFHAAFYYSFSTNKGTLLDSDISKLNNLGFRIGVAF